MKRRMCLVAKVIKSLITVGATAKFALIEFSSPLTVQKAALIRLLSVLVGLRSAAGIMTDLFL